ncbi:urease accessory protein [Sphaerotilus hippei]|uniref:Urease accessory protein UreD n=1 Tax=Sphaerotilus hippei TaxID=744406 RepID=A0A318GUX1_9BURK|nr:urease accessory protein UreD [Sphaerotilus hippei]PXW92852.1 urease accessory protein [Sphaerotilus hippei]
MGWQGHLQLDYRLDSSSSPPRTIAQDRHRGPLRVLQRLYPEGPSVCHHVLVHPPGGIVGGDELVVDIDMAPGTHALITTPGATRYYRSAGEEALQRVRAQVRDGARLEWLPLETIAYRSCRARNQLRFELAPGAEMIGWDVLALGLPAAGEAWTQGTYQQHLELPGVWLESARIDATDRRLLDSPLGWAGHRVLGTLWMAAGSALSPARRTELVASAHDAIQASGLGDQAGVSSTHGEVVVLRVLAGRVEPLMQLLTQVRARWRQLGWGLEAAPPRIWRT